MSQPLWYVRLGARVVGPHPAATLREWLELGDINADTEISLDQSGWISIRESRQFEDQAPAPAREEAAPWSAERAQARQRWLLDSGEAPKAAPLDPGRERQTLRALVEDRLHTEALLERELETARSPVKPWALLLMALAVGLTAFFIWRGQGEESAIQTRIQAQADCARAAGEGVDWSGCDKRGLRAPRALLRNARLTRINLDGADLTGADLGYATLDAARLRSANLRDATLNGAHLEGADLSGSDLSGADLRYAVLHRARLDGVRLDGARLGKAVWADGHECGEDAVGACP